MCTYATLREEIEGSAKGPGGDWFAVTGATVYFDHPVHAMLGHSLNVDVFDSSKGPGARVALELSPDAARRLATSILAMLDAAPADLTQAGRKSSSTVH